jgi:hypothetical protein
MIIYVPFRILKAPAEAKCVCFVDRLIPTMCSASAMMALATFFQRLRQAVVMSVFLALALAVLARAGHHVPHIGWMQH